MANYCVPYFNIIEHKFAFEEYDDAYKYIDNSPRDFNEGDH